MSWMLARLKRNAQSEHVAANIDRLSPLHLPPSADAYRDYLVRIFGFEAPVEAAVAATPGVAELLNLESRSHLRQLKADLATLGVPNVDELPLCRSVPRLISATEALGWLYVVEHNATLHAQVRRHIDKRLGTVAASYLAAGEQQGPSRIQELGAVLDRFAREPQAARQVVEAVKLAFRRQRQWFAVQDIRPTRAAQ
jgi:heme oxygenase